MLCAFSMMINSAAVVAQSKDKQQKSSAQQPQEPVADVFWIGEPAQEPAFQIALADPAQRDVMFTPATQVEFIHNEFGFDGNLVKDAPYSADAVTETIQMLYDGNRIARNSSSKIYRDSAGRTRREHAMKAVGPWAVSGGAPITIFINDPVAGVHYNLNSDTKTAHKMAAPFKVFRGGDANMGAELKARMRDKPNMRVANDAEAGVVTATADGVVTRTATGGGASGVSMVAGERVVAWSGGEQGHEVKKESLGAQMIEGVMAEGTRVTITVAAGKIGNERAIVTVNERWYSPELQTVVLSKNSDPRMGETTYRLTNIVRGEPDPSLFDIPADYTVKEGVSFRSAKPAEMIRDIKLERKPKN